MSMGAAFVGNLNQILIDENYSNWHATSDTPTQRVYNNSSPIQWPSDALAGDLVIGRIPNNASGMLYGSGYYTSDEIYLLRQFRDSGAPPSSGMGMKIMNGSSELLYATGYGNKAFNIIQFGEAPNQGSTLIFSADDLSPYWFCLNGTFYASAGAFGQTISWGVGYYVEHPGNGAGGNVYIQKISGPRFQYMILKEV
jgi:hypothetical protein